MSNAVGSQSMGRPKVVNVPQTQIRITRQAYEAVRKAAEIRKMTPPAYVSMVALEAAKAEILEDARKIVAEAEAVIDRGRPAPRKSPPKR